MITLCSGLNWNRKGLHSLLDQCFQGMVQEVALLHKDRLAHFALELLEYIFKKNDVKLMVVSDCTGACPKTNEAIEAVVDPAQELADNLITVTGFFMVRHHGLRSAVH